jgi:membrane-bound metal-dependent hydrolase YbcI (DUF457 family)
MQPPVLIARFSPSAHAALALILILAIDTFDPQSVESRALEAILDESAHVATALLAVGALVSRPPLTLHWGALMGAVLIDLDHAPREFWGSYVLTFATYRPYGHSLFVVCLLLVLAAVLHEVARPKRGGVAWSLAAVGATLGVASHLLRDLVTGGVPLLWPLRPNNVEVPYLAYIALLLIATLLCAWRGNRLRRADGDRG